MTPDDVLNAQFASSGLRAGYDMDSVDGYLDRVVHALRQGEPLPPWEAAANNTVRMQGYQFVEVEAFLISLGVLEADAAASAGRVGADSGQQGASGGPATGEVSGSGWSVTPGTYDHSRPGLLRRLFGRR